MEMREIKYEKRGGQLHFPIPDIEEGNVVSLVAGDEVIAEKIFEGQKGWWWLSHDFITHYPHIEYKLILNRFSCKGNKKTNLHYLHPTKCGGSSIENEGYNFGIRWSKWKDNVWLHWALEEYFTKNPAMLTGKILFTSVRDPYSRIVSTVYCPYNQVIENRVGKELTLEEFNDKITYSTNEIAPLHCYTHYKGEQIVKNILKLENLENDFNKLMEQHGLEDVKLTHHSNQTYYKGKKWDVGDITQRNIELINNKFEKDFEYFGYAVK
jgi:hypothetical protein